MRTLKKIIPVLMLICSMLACAMDESLGTIEPAQAVDCAPIEFMLRGETNHIWEANVIANMDYNITVTALDSVHPINSVHILVFYENVLIASDTTVDSETDSATRAFQITEAGVVEIRVSSSIGEDQENLGLHTMMLCEVN